MQQVTDSYLLGIKEGRALYREIRVRHGLVSREDMRALAQLFEANCTANLARGFARELADVFRGERDFWRGQIKKLDAERK